MNKCIHDSGEGRKVACGLGLYGGNPHIGVCRRACAMYQLPGESKPAERSPPAPMRGVGDLVAKATKLVGIKPCGGCKDRQEWLNKTFPFVKAETVIKHRMCGAEKTVLHSTPGIWEAAEYSTMRSGLAQGGNIAIWGGNWSAASYSTFKANILFLENGLINQSRGFYLDNMGFFGNSSIRQKRLWEQPVTEAETAIAHRAAKDFGWTWGQAADPNGPILIALQRRQDTGCHRFFPVRGTEDSIEVLLRLCAKHLPKRKVIVRPHPRFKQEWETRRDEYQKYFRPDWEVNMDGSIYPMLPKCSALVTVNSTVATEALALNMPIATLGESVWSDSGATLECADAPDKLAKVLESLPDMDRRLAVFSAVLKRQVPYNRQDLLHKHPAFVEWVSKLQ